MTYEPTIFDSAHLNKLVEDVIKTSDIPPDHKMAVVGTFNLSGVQVVVAFKSQDEHWEFIGAFEHDWSGDNRGEGRVIFSK